MTRLLNGTRRQAALQAAGQQLSQRAEAAVALRQPLDQDVTQLVLQYREGGTEKSVMACSQ
jgi:hypothetical protein